jgi:hypothetical protein
VARGEHELLVRPPAQDRPVARADDPPTRDGISEAPVGDVQLDAVAGPQLVDVPERLEVRRAVTSDGNGAAGAG